MEQDNIVIKKLSKNRIYIIVLCCLAMAFFFVYSYLSWSTSLKFNSPDETANYYFSKLYVESGQLKTLAPLNDLAGGIVHPRSINVVSGYLAPGSFLGMILFYGSIAKVIGVRAIPYLTPFFAVLAVLFFYGLIRRIFDREIAFISSVLLFFLPAFWYYAGRSMFHNVLFSSFLIIGFYFLVRFYESFPSVNYPKDRLTPYLHIIAGGLSVGLALIVRTSEILWVGLALIFLLLFRWRRLKLSHIIIFLAVVCLVFIPVFYYNQILYNSPFATGYTNQTFSSDSNSAVLNTSSVVSQAPQAVNLLAAIFPFGLHPGNVMINVFNYYPRMFWWLAIPALLGILMYLWRGEERQGQKIYFLLFTFVAFWLFVYYGSWNFHDSPDPRQIAINASYVRYWLPVYILSLPYISLVLLKLFKRALWGKAVSILLFILIIFFSVYSAVYNKQDSILKVRNDLVSYQNIAEEVFRLTETNSVIIAGRSDKVFFPERQVIFQAQSEQELAGITHLLERDVPVYYFNPTLSSQDISLLDNKLDVKISESIKTFGNLSLYKLNKLRP